MESIVSGGLANVHDTISLDVMGLTATRLSLFVVVPHGLLCQHAMAGAGTVPRGGRSRRPKPRSTMFFPLLRAPPVDRKPSAPCGVQPAMSGPRPIAWFLIALLGFAFLPGCAGFRGGWESVPYVGDTPPDLPRYRTPYEAAKRSELSFPGVTVGVGIDNQRRTHDTQVYFFILPLSVNPRNVYTQTDDTATTRVTLRAVPKAPGFVFRPRRARLTAGGKTVQGAIGFEFGQWDAERRRVRAGGTWGYREVGDEFPLGGNGTSYSLSIEFPIALPDPESPDIQLDLAEALRAPGQPTLPPIRFRPARWKEGYT